MSAANNTVILVGRTNVGKSTFFNRLSSSIKTIAYDMPGVTRDIVRDEVNFHDHKFTLVDSGGITIIPSNDEIDQNVRKQVINELENSDLVLFIVDGAAGVLPEDKDIARYLHKTGKKVLLVLNKADKKAVQENLYDFYSLGFNDIFQVSAEHGDGITKLLDKVVELLPKKKDDKEESKFSVALLGKPNVGKSSLMNMLLKEERSIVNPLAGTTRDPVSEDINFYSETIKLIDTAGIRRKRAVNEDLEGMMVKSSFHAVRNANVILLLIDGSMGSITDQELKLAFYIFEEGKALIILNNKQDLMDAEKKIWQDTSLEPYKYFLKKVEWLNISCKSGKNIGKILPLVTKVWQKYNFRINDHELFQFLFEAMKRRPLYHKTILLKIYGAEQRGVAPMHLVLYVNYPEWFGPTQLGYFENQLRREYDLKGVPITFSLKKGKPA